MKVAIISGSHRPQSNSFRTAELVASMLAEVKATSDIFELAKIDLAFWSEDLWKPDSAATAAWQPYRARLSACDAVVVISPEWAGMVPPKLINFFLHCSGQELAYKPTFLIGVSSGQSGTYPIAQLRLNVSKNNQMVFLPDHLIIRHANDFFGPAGANTQALHDRLRFNLDVLGRFSVALKSIREHIDLARFPYGL